VSATPKRRVRVKGHPGIYRSVSGRYEVAWRDETGALRFRVVSGGLEYAKAERARIVAKKASGESVSPPRVTFEQFGREWLETLTVRSTTIALYTSHFNKHLVPAFGTRKLAEITPDHVAAWLAKQKRDGASPYTIRGRLTPLSLILRRAERAGLIGTSPVRKLEASERPASSNGERRSLDSAEIAKLLGAAGKHKVLVAVGAFGGLRISEALGLTWEDVDFDEGVLRVRKQLGRDGRGSTRRRLGPCGRSCSFPRLRGC
jgi:integrase